MIDLTRMYAITIAPTSGTTPTSRKCLTLFGQLVPEVDDTGEPGDAVVEKDEDPGREDRVESVFSLTSVRPTYQTIERTAIQIVATPGVMCSGGSLANRFGNAP